MAGLLKWSQGGPSRFTRKGHRSILPPTAGSGGNRKSYSAVLAESFRESSSDFAGTYCGQGGATLFSSSSGALDGGGCQSTGKPSCAAHQREAEIRGPEGGEHSRNKAAASSFPGSVVRLEARIFLTTWRMSQGIICAPQ